MSEQVRNGMGPVSQTFFTLRPRVNEKTPGYLSGVFTFLYISIVTTTTILANQRLSSEPG